MILKKILKNIIFRKKYYSTMSQQIDGASIVAESLKKQGIRFKAILSFLE